MPVDKNLEKWDHQLVVVEEVAKLLDRGFTCYLEYELKTLRRRLFVDIYAVKGLERILIEVGTLSVNCENRLTKLKELMPSAKIIHVQQCKNFPIPYPKENKILIPNSKEAIQAIHKVAQQLD